MDVAIYARFSSSKQNEMSIEAQVLEAEEYCKRNNYNIVEVYKDRAKTAKTDKRPDFQRMILDSYDNKFQAVIVYQFDRFARNRIDSCIYKSKLKENGIRVISVKETITDDASGIMFEGLMESWAEYFSVELSQKVNRNMRLNAQKGYFNGGVLGLGFKLIPEKMGNKVKKRIAIDEKSAPIAKECFQMVLNNIPIVDIMEFLKAKGYKKINGKELKRGTLDRMFRNKRYIGTNSYGKEEFPDVIPAILDKELFDKVQEFLDSRKLAPAKSKAKEEYILTTKLFCGKCNEMLTGTSGTGRNGTVHYYYGCNGKRTKKCKKKNVKKHEIENLVISLCRALLTDDNIDKISEKVYDICQKEDSRNYFVKVLEKRIKELFRSIENIIRAIESGQNVDLYNNRLTELRTELDQTEKTLKLEKSKIVVLTKDEIKFFLLQLRNGNTDDIKYRKILVNIFVNKIYLYDDKIMIIFNVGKEPLTITVSLLEELEANLLCTNGSYLNKVGTPYYKRKKYGKRIKRKIHERSNQRSTKSI